jgi:hypothetical protein
MKHIKYTTLPNKEDDVEHDMHGIITAPLAVECASMLATV